MHHIAANNAAYDNYYSKWGHRKILDYFFLVIPRKKRGKVRQMSNDLEIAKNQNKI
jgi:hypothetical protein